MSAQIIQFQKPTPCALRCLVPQEASGFSVEVPASLASRIELNAMWNAKPPQKFVLDLLESVFSSEGDAA